MTWQKVRQHYPHQWLLLEAIKAHSEPGKRIVSDLSVIDTFSNSTSALQNYLELHREAPDRELYVFHTEREQLNIEERLWSGIRRGR